MLTRLIPGVLALLLAVPALAEETADEPKPSEIKPAPEKPYNPFELEMPLSDDEDADVIRLRFFGQHRTRYELRAPATYSATPADQPATQQFNMRTRLGADAQFPGSVNVLFELQDLRLWRDEPRGAANTVNTSGFEALEVLQAHIYTKNLFYLGIDGYAGRQKFTSGNQRLISTLEWAPQSQTCDGLRAQRSFFDGQLTFMGFAMLINELNRVQDDEWMLGFSTRWAPEVLPKCDLELLLLHRNR